MTLAIYRPDSLRIAVFADSQEDVWTFYKIGKRGGKLYRNQSGTVVYESSLPKGATKKDRELTSKEQQKLKRFERKQQRKEKRKLSKETPPGLEKATPLTPAEVKKANRKLELLRSYGKNVANNFMYSARKSLEAKRQALIEAATAARGENQGSMLERAKKVGLALSKAAFGSYHLHSKRYGKPLAILIEGVKASINLAVSSPFVLIPGVGAAIRNSITGPAVDYVARQAAKQIIRLRQIARGHRKPRFFSEEKQSEMDLQQLVKIIRTSLHVDAIKARVPVPRVSFEQVARSLESLLNTAIPDEQFQRKAA